MNSRRLFLAIGAAASISFSVAADTHVLDTANIPALVNMKTLSKSHTEVKRVLLGKVDGEDIVAVFYQDKSPADGHSFVKRALEPRGSDNDDTHQASNEKSNQTLIDMSYAQCTSVACYPGSFQSPERKDCDAIAAQQLSQTLSKDKLTAFPGTWVYVYHRTCAVVFQNPSFNSNYALQYKWSLLGNVILDLEERCFRPDALSIGGACMYQNYKEYEFQNVLISLQRIIQNPSEKPAPATPDSPKV